MPIPLRSDLMFALFGIAFATVMMGATTRTVPVYQSRPQIIYVEPAPVYVAPVRINVRQSGPKIQIGNSPVTSTTASPTITATTKNKNGGEKGKGGGLIDAVAPLVKGAAGL